MRFSLDSDLNHYSITSYGPDWVRVNDREFRRSLIVSPEQLVSDWPPQTFGDLVEAHFEVIASLEPEIVLLGTGSRQRFPRPPLLRTLLARGVGVEIMDTAAACRTYNIIMLEGRRVAAALLLLADRARRVSPDALPPDPVTPTPTTPAPRAAPPDPRRGKLRPRL